MRNEEKMRCDPYQAFEGEVFTVYRKKMYILHQKLKGVYMQLFAPFNSHEEAEAWAMSNKRALQARAPKARLFIRYDYDD